MTTHSSLMCLTALCCLWPVAHARADQRPAASIGEIARVVDEQLDRALAKEGVQPAYPADEANLLRRLSLDLIGRIPTTPELQSWLAERSPEKRAQWIDRLTASPEFLAHQVNELDALLMYGTKGSLQEYLTVALREGRHWDRIFTDLMLAREDGSGLKGADQFLKVRIKDTDRLTNDVSMLFFGVNISCTQCHDHPLVDEWKQDHFYGLKSFFVRSFDNGGFLAEREYGVVSYKTPKGEDRAATLMFVSGTKPREPAAAEPSNDEKKAEMARFKEWAKQKVAPPAPKFSRRALLAELALRPGENRFFARSIVNRLWYRLMGYGLVMPLDQLRSENTASHPELLDWLSRDLIANGYDLTRTIRGLVLSKAYARSSQWTNGERPKAELFAVAQVRPLSPLQLAASLHVATTDPEFLATTEDPAEASRRVTSIVNQSRSLAPLFDMPQGDFQVGTTEPLLFSNGERIASELLSAGSGRLVGRLKQLSSSSEQLDTAYAAVLSRRPETSESELLAKYLDQRRPRPVEGLQQVVWALLSSAEFRFNY